MTEGNGRSKRRGALDPHLNRAEGTGQFVDAAVLMPPKPKVEHSSLSKFFNPITKDERKAKHESDAVIKSHSILAEVMFYFLETSFANLEHVALVRNTQISGLSSKC